MKNEDKIVIYRLLAVTIILVVVIILRQYRNERETTTLKAKMAVHIETLQKQDSIESRRIAAQQLNNIQ